MIKNLLLEFINKINNKEIDIYNEFSLQHELGIFLRKKVKGYKIEFERNVSFFEVNDTVKKEIDIVIYNNNEKYAIELKYPLNGQYPEQMYSFIKDICFMEELKFKGFTNTYCLTLVNDKNFYSGRKLDGIYAYFRDNKPICGEIFKPTGNSNKSIILNNKYNIKWTEKYLPINYYIIEI